MPTQIQFRRGTSAQTAIFTGANGEITVDTDRKTIVLHDGLRPGGWPLPTLNIANTQNASITYASNHANAAFNAANTAGGADTVARNTANAAFSFANTVLANVAMVAYNYVAGQGTEIFGWGDFSGNDGLSGGAYGNDNIDASSPVQIPFGKGWVHITESWNTTVLGIKNDGTLWGWGFNTSGTIGDGTIIKRSSPTQIGTFGGWKKTTVDSTGSNSLAIKHDGSLWSWGLNSNGELGHNDTVNKSSPVQVGSSSTQTSFNWTDIVCARFTTLGVKSDGTLWSWGYNEGGALGLSTAAGTDARSSPTQIGANTRWQAVSMNSGFGNGPAGFALTQTGELWSWGSNDFGMLARDIGSDLGRRSSPAQVGTNNNWAQITTNQIGSGVCAALKSDGTLWTWGYNADGRLGINTSAASSIGRSSPAQVGTRTDWARVFVGHLAVRRDGTIWSWGLNPSSGILGDNQTANFRSSPVQLFATSNRSPRGWRTIASIGFGNNSFVAYAGRWSDQGVGIYSDDYLNANNEILGT